ncbi:protein-disulfide reductase DsbD family protein [Aurantiacibacter sp. MUD11]|uniref:protein-disulfide reductase DsbD family protein n=1 Tax=Aurantiacibacter sp. MUD11 TaxID=3003265 RepID=UPI0022AA438C|nr:thioredoxin family protein [Aurantiacibacter sp. MUD11]WAT17782.1 protein-disulfide reductase DsbD family protein [Aurantiacibacter sp. MUD11]
MQASTLSLFRYVATLLALFGALLVAPVAAQQPNRIAADLVAEHAPLPGETLTVALRFRPDEGWHGYWANPGDAGEGMVLDWNLPAGWQAGEPQYPVPERLELIGLINHVYKDPYAVLVPLEVPADTAVANIAPITVEAQWLACSDRLCVPERATLTLRFPQETAELRNQFDAHRAAIPPLIDQQARLAVTDQHLRLAVPLPAAVGLPDPHVYIEQKDVIDYGAVQAFYRDGDLLVAEIARGGLRAEPDMLAGILAFGDEGEGIRFTAAPGEVPTGGARLGGRAVDTPLYLLLGGALLGGLLLNLMPCVFPILSLKALTLARAGGEERQAKVEGVAYTAGVVLACLALGALLLVLRAGGAQIGWAFQLQEPLVVAALLVLALLITANFAGLFEIPSLPIRTRGEGGAFATGLLAAVVATPCTGPFMAAALGAALLLPAAQALLLFAALGFGLALPFLLLGFVPALRRMLPKPGAWMETFRKVLAVPMGLTALALAWLAWRLGGAHFAFGAAAVGVLIVVVLISWRQRRLVMTGIATLAALYFTVSLPFRVEEQVASAESLLDPVAYSETALAEARASGQPVFLWFTADWCLTCKVNEQVAIEREATREAFEEAGVVAMRGDWTQRDPEITRYLEEWQVAGVPLYVWYPAGGAGEQLPQVLTPDMLAELASGAD